jgi:hypothetical protein
VPLDGVYSSVVSLRGIRTVAFLAEHNDLELWATDVGNAYLEAKTSEKLYIIAGPEFGEREGHTLVMYKALYGTRTAGKCWHDRFAAVLRKEGFFPSLAEQDIWMRDKHTHYEYIAVYVDDLLIASTDPKGILERLTGVHKLKLKGSGPIKFHLGCDFIRDENGHLCMTPRSYIERMLTEYERHFNCKPSLKYRSPLEPGDHPELDTSDELGPEGITMYQSLVGSMQWAVSLGRLDITTAVMTLSRFRCAPRVGHLERVKRVYGYLSKFRFAAIRFRTEKPDYSELDESYYDWSSSVYGDTKEEIPKDAPPPRGKSVISTTYVDANLCHDLLNGKAVTGILYFLNQTPIDWYSKLQATVETATYGSEFVAARTAVQLAKANRLFLRYLGVPIEEKEFMFGDNKSVVTSSTIPQSALSKRHHALAYHTVRAAIAEGWLDFHHHPGSLNPADLLSKHWAHAAIWPMLRAILFWSGDTASLLDEPEGSDKNPVTQNPESESQEPGTGSNDKTGKLHPGNDGHDVGMKEARMGDEEPRTLGEGSQPISTDELRTTS